MGNKFAIECRNRAFARNDKGNVAMLFALACLVIFPLVGFAVDLSRVYVEKQKLQQATDAAALAAAHDAFMTADERRVVIEAHLNHLEEDLGREIEYDLTQDDEGRISLITRISVNTTISKIMGVDEVNLTVRSDAIEGGADIEVAMILDVTGSMAGSRITALRQAGKDLVSIVVKDEQEPYYSKASMVPYAVAVNVGAYADGARGTIKPGIPITDAEYLTGLERLVIGASKTNPVKIDSLLHGFSNGDKVYITGVKGMTQLNGKAFTVKNASLNAFELSGVNGSSYSKYKNSGTIQKCITSSCEVRVTANGHGQSNGDEVVIKNVKGMTQINTGTNATWDVSNVTANTYVLDGSYGPDYNNYTSAGTSYCTTLGCQYYRFNNASSNSKRVYEVTSCATERTGADAFTTVGPAGSPVGAHYAKNASECPTNQLIPLTADKTLLTDAVDALTTGGSTAGHMGAAWGLYTLSPNFGSLFPADSMPAAFGRPKLYKFAVFMTDGEFNSSFCKNVLAKGSNGSSSDQINCTAENGDPFDQAQEYCTAMKNAGIKVYTVGLQVANGTLKNTLTSCATSAQYAYFPAKPEDLITVFQQIGRDINEVRLVK
jgi:Flp pilus assembly protein TadG